MALKSLSISKLDYQMSKSWKKSAAHELETTSKFDKLKNWVPDSSAQDRILVKTQPHGSRVMFKPSKFQIPATIQKKKLFPEIQY